MVLAFLVYATAAVATGLHLAGWMADGLYATMVSSSGFSLVTSGLIAAEWSAAPHSDILFGLALYITGLLARSDPRVPAVFIVSSLAAKTVLNVA